jgi:cation diffusion facilitator CzcD-associated flavoprotein CzcO
MWRAKKDEDGDKCAPAMRTNLSRFTVAFADLSWSSVNLGPEDGASHNASPPMFPEAHQVGRYLDAYKKRFLPENVLTCNREVTHAKLSDSEPRTWTVTSLDKASQTTHQDSFDYLIVASGFFDRPSHSLIAASSPQIPIQHSSKFRSVASLSPRPGKVVVIGGGISGSEAAATAALQISNAKYTPGNSKPAWSESTVYHVFDRPFYCLPRYLPQDPYNPAIQDFRLAPDFLPVDLCLYNLSRRGEGPISATNGLVPADKAKKGHEFIRSVIGGDQRDLGRPELVCKPEQTAYPAYTGLSDTYTEFVRSGLIVPIQGRAEAITDTSDSAILQLAHKSSWAAATGTGVTPQTQLEDVVGIIEATGFQVHLDYLDADVKQALDYDPTCHRLPFLLSRGSIFNPNIPELAFIGFYEGPYWGIMEMQAHLVAQKWATDSMTFPTDVEETNRVREALKNRDLSVPQFWMPDYVGMMEEFSRHAGIPRTDTPFFAEQTGPAFPARYTAPLASTTPNNIEAETTIRDALDALNTTSTRFVAAATFRALQGPWTLRRKITSRHPSAPGGNFTGTAHFHPRYPTAPGFDAEYLYIEEGTFTMDNGFKFPATRRYVYRYAEQQGKISTWFVDEDRESAERVFNELVFERPLKEGGEEDTERGWLAKSEHWCEPDSYNTRCEFRFRGAGLAAFGVVYVVSGPQKDYEHESWYERPVPGS